MIDYSPGKKIEDAVEAYKKFDRQLAAVISQGYLILEGSGRLYEENAKLRELVSLYDYGATHEASPSDTLAWSSKVDSLRRELGIEVDDD